MTAVAVIAIQQIRRMRGGAQSHLMLASDNNLYVVKFRNNPQHVRVLANELLATRLAAAVGLAVPPAEVIEVSEWLIQNTEELTIELRGGAQRCQAGLHFASRWVGGLMPGQTVDYLPQEQLLEVRNLAEFAGILALDKWTCNINGRQAVFQKEPAGAPLQRDLYRPGILFSCRGLEICRRPPGRRFCRKYCLSRGHRLGELRTLAEPDRESGPGNCLGHRGDHSAGVVRRGSERAGSVDRSLAGAAGAGSGVDRGIWGIGEKAISELGGGGGKGSGGRDWGR